jgi:hypothetical protein
MPDVPLLLSPGRNRGARRSSRFTPPQDSSAENRGSQSITIPNRARRRSNHGLRWPVEGWPREPQPGGGRGRRDVGRRTGCWRLGGGEASRGLGASARAICTGRGGPWPPDHARVRDAAPVAGHDDAGLGIGGQQRRRNGGEDTMDACAHIGLHCSAGEALGGRDDRGSMASAMAMTRS